MEFLEGGLLKIMLNTLSEEEKYIFYGKLKKRIYSQVHLELTTLKLDMKVLFQNFVDRFWNSYLFKNWNI